MPSSQACAVVLLCGGLLTTGCSSSSGDLIAQLNDGDPVVRRAAARALGEQPNQSAAAVAALGRATNDPDLEVRENAVDALAQKGSAAKSSASALEQALDDSEVSVRLKAALAIRAIDPANRSYVPVFVESLRAGHGPVFLEVGRMGVEADWAVPTLVALLSDRRATIRALAARTLGTIGVADGSVESALQRSLRDDHPTVRKAAQQALDHFRSQSTTGEP
jgi:HEAT repeat protein